MSLYPSDLTLWRRFTLLLSVLLLALASGLPYMMFGVLLGVAGYTLSHWQFWVWLIAYAVATHIHYRIRDAQ